MSGCEHVNAFLTSALGTGDRSPSRLGCFDVVAGGYSTDRRPDESQSRYGLVLKEKNLCLCRELNSGFCTHYLHSLKLG
jgi:hypothetical protein